MFKRSRYQLEYRQKLNADKKRMRMYNKAMRKKMKEEARQEKKLRRKNFLSHPFQSFKPNPEQELKRELKQEYRQNKRLERKRWLERFKKNPLKTLFTNEKNKDHHLLMEQMREERKYAQRNRIKIIVQSFKDIFQTSELRNKYSISLIQSTTYFILSFLLIYIINQFTTMLVAKGFDIPTVWYYYRVKFPLFAGSQLYTRTALIGIFASGPVISLVTGFIMLKLYFSKSLLNKKLRLFYLWGFVNGINFFFGAYLVGFVTRTEFIYASEWLFMSSMFDVEEIVFAVLSITISLLIGRLITPLFLLSSSYPVFITSKYRFAYILSNVFIPWLIGAGVFLALSRPVYYLPLTLKTITPALLLFPSILTYNSIRNDNIANTGKVQANYFRWSIVIIVIALLFFYRLLLNFGLQLF
ncbi:MAG: hypothetical protein IPH45_02035 [Bacteroidales bacterium]|nr:hypothetical protein [Bacteroidales bacterium]